MTRMDAGRQRTVVEATCNHRPDIIEPMLLDRARDTETYLHSFILQRFGVDLGPIISEFPPRIEFGDLAFPFAFELAKVLRRPPRQIAQEVVDHIESPPWIERFQAAGGGYVNAYLERTRFFKDVYTWLGKSAPDPDGDKIIVEHTNINPNKAAHIGHLRNAALGDTFARILRARGSQVEVQNYIDDTGVQVADVVVGFQRLRKMDLLAVENVDEPFDYYCWDLYAETANWYTQDESHLKFRLQALHEIETGAGETAELAEHISLRIVRAHLKTMWRIGVSYDVLPRESEILKLKFWEEAWEQLQASKAVTYVESGPHSGCWVMRLPGEEGQTEEEKIIVRSNGTVTYVGKDIAYQLWKFGLLSRGFHYRPFHQYPDQSSVWMTTSSPNSKEQPEFGRGRSVYNVIDVRQSYLQRVVVHGLRSLGYEQQADDSVHFSYEMVALSPGCCAELGIQLSEEDRAKPYVEVSGRKGLGVKADDLIDKLIERSLQEVSARQEELSLERRQLIARQIAVGALRYFLLKYARNSVIAFDFAEALSFEGETGPYLQYSVVRSKNIFSKLETQEGSAAVEDWKRELADWWTQVDGDEPLFEESEVWALLLQIGRLQETVDQSIRTLEMSYLAKHAFVLAQSFNIFYHKHHILSEEDRLKRCLYLTIADAGLKGLTRALDLLGIEAPEKM